MACEIWKERLVADLYGELAADADRDAVRVHLSTCAACRDTLEGWTASRAALRAAELPVPASPRMVSFPLRPIRQAALPFAAGFAAAALIAAGMAAGFWVRSPVSGVGAADVEARLAEQHHAFQQALEARDRELRAEIAASSGGRITREQVLDLLAASERRVDQRRATDVRYLLGEIGAAEMRAGASIGETQRALQYVALANNPGASLH